MTGREVISNVVEIDADRIVNAIHDLGFVLVPREPTLVMLREAWASGLTENAAGVWKVMIDAFEVETTEQEIKPDKRQYGPM